MGNDFKWPAIDDSDKNYLESFRLRWETEENEKFEARKNRPEVKDWKFWQELSIWIGNTKLTKKPQ